MVDLLDSNHQILTDRLMTEWVSIYLWQTGNRPYRWENYRWTRWSEEEEGASGQTSCPADRQAASWWTHLTARSTRNSFCVMVLRPWVTEHKQLRVGQAAEHQPNDILLSKCSSYNVFTPLPLQRMWRETNQPCRWLRPSTSHWLQIWCRSWPRLPPEETAPWCPESWSHTSQWPLRSL